jgi:aminoglycoside phosphotransferase (APT) family kinase protein
VSTQAPLTTDQARQLLAAARPGWRLLRIRPFAGATSAQVTAIDARQADGQPATVVLRQYGAANLRADPHAARSEFRLLRLLGSAGLPVPTPFLADETGAIVPGPCLLQEFIDGERVDNPPDLADFIRQLAAFLAGLHNARIARAEVGFLADVGEAFSSRLVTAPARPDEFLRESEARAALTRRWPPPPVNEPVVLHGDFWPGNVVWRDGKLAGVIDWEDASFGDPLADLAITRLEIGWFHGAAAMDQVTTDYLALRPVVNTTTLPLWDLRAALRACAFPLQDWGMPPQQLTAMRAALRDFADSALRRLAETGSA